MKDFEKHLDFLSKMQGSIQEDSTTSVGESFKNYFKGFLDFSGKSIRFNYWIVFLIISVSSALIFMGLTAMVANDIVNSALVGSRGHTTLWANLIFVWILISIALGIPSSALIARRARDIGFTVWTARAIGILYFATHFIKPIQFLSWFMSLAAFVIGFFPSNGLKKYKSDSTKTFIE